MLPETALSMLYTKSYKKKPMKTSCMILPELVIQMAELARYYEVSNSAIIEAGLIMMETAHRSEMKKREFYDEETPA